MTVEPGALLLGDCQLADNVTIRSGAVIGKSSRPMIGRSEGREKPVDKRTTLCHEVYIGYYTTVGNGAHVGAGAVVDDFCSIGARTHIGAGTLITHRAQVSSCVVVGQNCVVGGFIAERVLIEDGCRVFGKLVHSQLNPTLGWDDGDAEEPSAVICARAFIGCDAVIIGNVRIGSGAYVCAGAVITKDVPAGYIARGFNELIAFEDWQGPLSRSPFVQGEGCSD